jgi:tetrahydromethanopterin S-methyltransferase subunit G
MITERFDKIDKKLDTVIDNQHKMELKFTRKVGRNSLIINGMLWGMGLLATAGAAYLFTLIG